MSPIIVPITSSNDARWAIPLAIESYRRDHGRIHLLAVQHRLPRHVSRFLGRRDLDAYYHEAGMRALEPAMRMLDEAGIGHEEHVLSGREAETIVGFAAKYRGSRLILDDRQGLLSAFALGSVANQVRHLLRVGAAPVVSPDTPGPN
jgi:nucleotide-binding universal stress UspA family protein